MVMIALTSPVVEINGRIGNNIYRNSGNGQYMTADVYRHHIPTRKQLGQRTFFFKAARFAGHAENIELHYDCWWIWSFANPIINKKGERKYMIPFLAATKFNIHQQQKGFGMRICPFHIF